MATFTNQAQLTYNNVVTNSNVAVGEIIEVLSATKTAVPSEYTSNGNVTYVVNIVNSGDTAYNGITVTDNLGAYAVGTETYYPLTYVDGNVLYFINGVPQAAPGVTQTGNSVSFTGISVPANGNATIVYDTVTNAFAPLATGSTITNTIAVSGAGFTPFTATSVITASDDPVLSITKSISPVPVTENGTLTYTFVIQNYGNTPADATDNVILTDTFDPVLGNVTATYEGTVWTAGNQYTYDQTTGVFATTAGNITVPAATYTQNADGTYTVTPGSVTLVVTGTV
ncbi:MAG: hypothetical protein J6A50_01295 [Clostridia bacterium]|nr:hypothetical protein [Clostridia bacterium]